MEGLLIYFLNGPLEAKSGSEYFVTLGLLYAYTLHKVIEINVKIEICESRTPILSTLLMISLKVDLVKHLL